ncbi:hypothetical protein IFM89_036134 [Coptis chinensis]|uniref:Transposase n=1 Tax=Coptis chinensis TaxID=261450 RepID=A0A835HUF1_9MAGN|nr:hypothetical protein IFM89_036134 [Coptis chinensis]
MVFIGILMDPEEHSESQEYSDFEENSDSEDGSEEHSNSKDGSQGHSDLEDGFEDHSDSEKRSGSKDMEVDEAVAKGSSKKRKVRRAAKCVKFKKLKKGEYQGIVYNESGQPIGQGGTNIGSYGGYLVRARVRITITNWKDVSPTLKKNLWISLKEKFKLDTNERSIRTSAMGRLWKAFKSRLTRRYILPFKNKPKQLKKIPKLYRKVISQEDWDTFVKSRLTPEFLELPSISLQRMTMAPKWPKQQPSWMDPLKQYLIDGTLPSDEKLAWKLKYKAARDKRRAHHLLERIGLMGGNFPSKAKMDDYQTQVKEGTLEVEGTKDVLTLALGTPEHGGRVRGVGDGVTPTQYFRLIKRGSKKHVRALESKAREEEEKRKKGEQKRKKAEEKGEEERKKKKKELKNKYKELEANFNDCLTSPASEKIASNSHKSDNRDHIPPLGGAHSKCKPKNKEEKSRLLETNSEPDFRKVHAKGTSHSTLPNPMLPLEKIQLGLESCSLAVGSKSNIVAKGKDHVVLPIPASDEPVILKDALGSQVAWPKHLVVDSIEEKIGQPIKSKGDKTKSASHSKGSDLCTSFGAMIGTIIQSGRLKFPYGQELFGDNIEFSYIETNDVKDVCNLESVESPCMVAYMR